VEFEKCISPHYFDMSDPLWFEMVSMFLVYSELLPKFRLGHRSLSDLVVCSISPEVLACDVRKQCDLNDYKFPIISKMHHLSESRVVVTIVNKMISEPVSVALVQRAGYTAMSKEFLVDLILLHANCWTAVMLAAGLHCHALVDGHTADPATGRGDPRTFGMLYALKKCHKLCLTCCDSEHLSDNNEHGLKQTIGFFRIWLRSLGEFVDAVEHELFQRLVRFMKSAATALQSSVPRWESCITETSFNDKLAKETVLGSMNKSDVKSKHAILNTFSSECTELSTLLSLSGPSKLESVGAYESTIAFADSIKKSAEMCIVIHASLIAVLVEGMRVAGQSRAKDCLAVVRDEQWKAGALPQSLVVLLEALAEGDKSKISPFYGAEDTSAATKKEKGVRKRRAAGVKQQEVPEEKRMKAEPSEAIANAEPLVPASGQEAVASSASTASPSSFSTVPVAVPVKSEMLCEDFDM
jgi:hypothetical protein